MTLRTKLCWSFLACILIVFLPILTITETQLRPASEKQTLQTANKYMTDDVYVAPLTGLKPENIKKGVTILGVTGTYEGYS